MKTKNKGTKTTIVAITTGVLFLILVALLVLDIITLDKFTAIVASVTTIGLAILGYYAKDSDKSHTQDYDLHNFKNDEY